MFFLDEMITSAKRHQMRVVSGRRDGHGTRAPHVRVTQLVSQHLQLIRIEVIVIPQNMVVRWPTCSLQTRKSASCSVSFSFPFFVYLFIFCKLLCRTERILVSLTSSSMRQPELYLNSGVTAEIKVELGRVGDANVDGCAGRDIPALSDLILFVGAKQPRVVPFLHHDKGYTRLITNF